MTTKRLNLAKAGFVRRPDWDFSDDGSYFRCYEYKGLRISVCKYRDEYYVAVHHDERRTGIQNLFTWDDWSKTEAYVLEDEFNGCTDVDVDKLVQNCEVVLATIDELNAKVMAEPVDMSAVLVRADKEYKACQDLLAEARAEFAWWKVSKYEFTDMVNYMKGIENDMVSLDAILFDDVDKVKARSIIQHFNKMGYVKVSDDDFYFERIKKLLNKYRRV